ncbi:MAG: EamA family transporter RarD [Anaerolineales bacterium]|nr:EamA family transporter RarD [Anaerolineales bacterium]
MDKKGLLLALGAYFTWGLFPMYWKLLQAVPAPQLLGHRIVWSFVLLIVMLSLRGGIKALRPKIFDLKILGIYAIAAILVGINWLVYVWAVNASFIVETSLGYFINPLLSVVLGMIFFKERLRPLQWIPILLATSGVVYLTILYGRLPWIALTLAFSFGFYGLVKKMAPLNSAEGVTLETGILFMPALIYLVFVEINGAGAFAHSGLSATLLMIGAGLVTTIPLLMFAAATHRIPLTMVGLMQYLAPTMQFLIGIFVYQESFSIQQLLGFGLVWLGLLAFAAESLYRNRRVPLAKIPIQL